MLQSIAVDAGCGVASHLAVADAPDAIFEHSTGAKGALTRCFCYCSCCLRARDRLAGLLTRSWSTRKHSRWLPVDREEEGRETQTSQQSNNLWKVACTMTKGV